MQAKVTNMELRVRLRYKSTSDFGKGDHLNFDKSLAHALEWLYDEDHFEDERTWLYCMEGVLPIYIMMSIVTDIFTFALQDYAETNIKDYILRMEEGNYKHGWNDNKPSLLYLGDEIVLGKVHTFTSEVILWATYLYANFRADIEEDNEKLQKAKDVLYKLFWKKTGLKEEFVKDTFLMKHFDQTIHEFAKDVLHRYKDDKPVTDNKPQQTPVNNKMKDSVLNYISATEMRFYYEGWRNGKHGAICQWDGIYRFVEQSRGKSGVLDDVKRNKDDNPIVAIGIVAYWLQYNSRMDTVIKRLTRYKGEIPKDIREQFDTYTKERFNQFKAAHRDDPLTWDWDWDYEFYTKYIIPHEIELNRSSEVLFDYISDSDIKLVRDVMKSYIKYLKKCRADKGYRVDSELLILRAVDSQDETKYEDLEDYEVNTILEKLKDEGYIDAMWVHGQKLPWVCEMLDKGRVYLKKLEEGEIVPQNNKQSEGSQHEDEQTPSSSTEDDNITNDENIRDWDLFKDWILKDVVIDAIGNIPAGEVFGEVKRHFVIHKVLNEIGWLRHKQATRYIGLMKYHKVVDFAAVDFRDNDLKPFKKINTAEWGSHLTPDSDLGEKYRKFADIVRNTFTRVINGKLDDLERFYVKGKIRYNQVFIDDGNKKK